MDRWGVWHYEAEILLIRYTSSSLHTAPIRKEGNSPLKDAPSSTSHFSLLPHTPQPQTSQHHHSLPPNSLSPSHPIRTISLPPKPQTSSFLHCTCISEGEVFLVMHNHYPQQQVQDSNSNSASIYFVGSILTSYTHRTVCWVLCNMYVLFA